jgi:hypothetical protein
MNVLKFLLCLSSMSSTLSDFYDIPWGRLTKILQLNMDFCITGQLRQVLKYMETENFTERCYGS